MLDFSIIFKNMARNKKNFNENYSLFKINNYLFKCRQSRTSNEITKTHSSVLHSQIIHSGTHRNEMNQ